MKKFVKLFVVLLAVCMVLSIFAACGKKDPKPSGDDKPVDNNPVDDNPHTPDDNPPAHEHAWDEGKVTKDPTCTEAGEKVYTCECGETKTEAIAALGHVWNEGEVTKEATVDAEGEKTFTCTVCGETKVDVIEKLPLPDEAPDYIEGKDAKYKSNGDFTFTYLYFKGDAEATEVVIPAYIDGFKVVAVNNDYSSVFGSPDQFTKLTISEGIQKIGASAFAGFTGITEIVIPDSVTEIGENAFKGCTSLRSVKLGAGTKDIPANAFSGCNKIEVIDLGDGLYYLDTDTFADSNKTLVKVTIGKAMLGINNSFESAVKFGKLVVIVNNAESSGFTAGPQVTALLDKIAAAKLKNVDVRIEIDEDGYVFYLDENGKAFLMSYIGNGQKLDPKDDKEVIDPAKKVLRLPESFGKDKEDYSIYQYAFSGRNDIKTVIIGNGAISIGLSAFEDCAALETLIFDDESKLTEVGDYAFRNCSKLYTIEIPDSITYIADTAVKGCIDFWAAFELPDPTVNPCIHKKNNIFYLGNATNPYVLAIAEGAGAGELDEHTKGIATSAFSSTGLTSITIPAEVRFIGACAFENGDLVAVNFATGSQLKIIGAAAFQNNDALTAITIPASVTEIGVYAFFNCTALATVNFAAGSQLKTIGDEAFGNCKKLAAVTLPDSLTTICEYAFFDCNALATINFAGTSTQWAAVDKGTDWAYGVAATGITCTDKVVPFAEP